MLLKKQMAAKMKALHLSIKKCDQNIGNRYKQAVEWQSWPEKRSINTFDTGDQIFSRRTEKLVEAWSEGTEKDLCLAGESADRSKCLNEIIKEERDVDQEKTHCPSERICIFSWNMPETVDWGFLGSGSVEARLFHSKSTLSSSTCLTSPG